MATSSSSPLRVLRFGVYEADLRRRELRKNGLKLKLHGQPFQVLVLLLEKPGEIVTREEIRAHIWPSDTFVDFDTGLNKAVAKLRTVLGDDPTNPRFVETVPRLGYRLLVPVQPITEAASGSEMKTDTEAQRVSSVVTATPSGPEAPSQKSSRLAKIRFVRGFFRESKSTGPGRISNDKWRGAVLALALTILAGTAIFFYGRWNHRVLSEGLSTEIRSLVVLPLENLSGDPSQEYLADGMTDQLITNLAKIHSIRVISKTSAMHYKGTRRSLPEIARELNVDAVVEGTVVRSGNRVRLSVQLIDARADQHLWADNFEEDVSNIISLESDLTRTIAKQIRIELAVSETSPSARSVNPEAQEAYLRGRYYLNQGTSDGLDQSFGYFRQAVAIDPNYALGYAGLADAYVLKIQLGASGASPRQVFPEAKAAAEKALQLDDTLAESHATLGYVKAFLDHDWPGAEAEFEAALQLNPGYAVAHYYHSQSYLMPLGQTDKAIAEAREAVRLDPLSVVMNDQLGAALFFDRQYDQAVAQFQKTIALNENIVSPHWMLMLVYEQERKYPEALAEFQRIAILSGFSSEFVKSIGAAYSDSGPKGYWQKRLQMLDESRKNDSPNIFMEFARVYGQIGNTEQTVYWLERANNEEGAMGVTMLNVEPAFDSLRSNPRFQSLSHSMNLPPDIHIKAK